MNGETPVDKAENVVTEFEQKSTNLCGEIGDMLIERMPELDSALPYERLKAALVIAQALEMAFCKYLATLVFAKHLSEDELEAIYDTERMLENTKTYMNRLQEAENNGIFN